MQGFLSSIGKDSYSMHGAGGTSDSSGSAFTPPTQFFNEDLRFVLQCPMLRVSKFTELHAPVIHVAL